MRELVSPAGVWAHGGRPRRAVQRPLNELVHEVLRAHIDAGALARGLVLREQGLQRAFGIGRTPAATALRRLAEDGLITKRLGHGYVIGEERANGSLADDLEAAGLVVPASFPVSPGDRKRRSLVYPEVELAVASCLVFGQFRINQTMLAEHFSVSRTVAHEVLTALESIGFARREHNARWYTAPLTYERVRESYELRALLEPPALQQAAGRIGRQEILNRLDTLRRARAQTHPPPEMLNRIEAELHRDLVLRCGNERMRRILLHCQLPVIASYGTLMRDRPEQGLPSGIPETIVDHEAVLRFLAVGQVEEAAEALERHIRHGFELVTPHLLAPPPLDTSRLPPYLVPEGNR